MRDVYKFLGIDHIKTAPYRPQSNGCLERFHHTLLQMMRKSEADKKDWDVYLPKILFACREAPSSVTGFSPFDLLLGKHVRGPLDIIREQWVPSLRRLNQLQSIFRSCVKCSQLCMLSQKSIRTKQKSTLRRNMT